MSLKQKAVSGVKWNTIYTIYNTIIQILKIAILTRLLEKSDFGIIAIAMMVISFTEIFSDLGFTVGIIHKQDVSENQFSSLYWMNIFTSVLLFSIAVTLSPLLAKFYNEPILATIIPLLSIQILINAFGKLFQTIKTKNLEFKFLSVVKIISLTLGLVVTILLAYYDFGVYSLVIGQLLQVAVNQLIYAIAGRKDFRVKWYFKFSEVAEYVKIGVYQIGANFLDFLASKIDIFLIGRFFGMDNLGIYNLAKDLVLKPKTIISSLVNSVLISAFAKIQHQADLVRASFVRMSEVISFVIFPIFLVMLTFADPIVSILYSSAFNEVSCLLSILSIVGLLMTIDGLSSTLIVSFGRTEIGFYWTIVRVFLSVITILIASMFSIRFVAYGQVLVAILSFFLFWKFAIFKIIKLSLHKYISAFKMPLLLSLCSLFPIIGIMWICNFNTSGNICLLIIYIFLYVLSVWRFKKDILEYVKWLIIKKK